MFKNQSNHVKLDVSVNSNYKDMIMITGNDAESDKVCLEGTVKISSPADMHVKRIRLQLYGEFEVEYIDKERLDQIYERLCIFKALWSNLLTHSDGNVDLGNFGDKMILMSKVDNELKKTHSRSSLQELGQEVRQNSQENDERSPSISRESLLSPGRPHSNQESSQRPKMQRAKSTPHIPAGSSHHHFAHTLLHFPRIGISGTPFVNHQGSKNFLLPRGNYQLPFKIYLPENIPETVEGLKCGHVLYRLQCSIERGKFDKAIIQNKYLRIVRTLHPQNMLLVTEPRIEGTWKAKAEYNVSLKRKAVALGTTIPVYVQIVPYVKGLRLKSIKVEIIQQHSMCFPCGRSPTFQSSSGCQELSLPDMLSLSYDRWDIKSFYKVPNNLKELSPSCELRDGIFVIKHRMRVTVLVSGDDGRVNEVKANMPIIVYMSKRSGSAVGSRFIISPQGYFSNLATGDEEIYLHKHHLHRDSEVDVLEDTGAFEDESDESEEENNPAPPMYQQHFYDKPLSPVVSPDEIPAARALANSVAVGQIQSYFDIPPASRRQNQQVLFSPSFQIDLTTPSYSQVIHDENVNLSDNGNDNDLSPMYVP